MHSDGRGIGQAFPVAAFYLPYCRGPAIAPKGDDALRVAPLLRRVNPCFVKSQCGQYLRGNRGPNGEAGAAKRHFQEAFLTLSGNGPLRTSAALSQFTDAARYTLSIKSRMAAEGDAEPRTSL